MRYLLIVLLLTVGVVVLLSSTSRIHEPVDFTYINRGNLGTMDPAAMSWQQDIRMALTVWEGLCSYDPKTTEPVPGCAFAPQISDDRRTYTFTIRPDACWDNGDPVTAEQFNYAWRRACEPGTARDYSFFFDLIEGVKAYKNWRFEQIAEIAHITDPQTKRQARDRHLTEADARWKQTVGIEVLGDKTLRVTLIRPTAYFLDLCAFSTFLPVHIPSIEPFKIVSDNGHIFYNEQWVKPYNTHYNGPFVITEWKFKQHVLLKKNKKWWNADAVHLNTMRELEVEDANTAWLLYSGGQVDFLSYVETIFAPQLIAESHSPLEVSLNKSGTQREDIHAFSGFGTYFYNFNCTESLPDGTPNPFIDPRVRQAFTLAVDKQKLIDQVVRRRNQPAAAFVPPHSIPHYPVVEGLPHDPQRARALLAEAGWPEGKGFPEVVVLFNTGFIHGEIAQAIVGMWHRELGVNGRVQGMEGKTFLQRKKDCDYVVCRASWYGDYGDPTTFLEMFETGNGNNDSKYSDPKYDAMLQAAREEPDAQKRLTLLADAERYLVNEGLPLLPLYYYVDVVAFDTERVKNLYLTPRNMTMLWPVEVVE